MAAKGKVPACIVCSRQLEGGLLEWPQFPFCSQRCKLVDLGRWFEESHTLPAGPRTAQEIAEEIEELEARRMELESGEEG
ncbi:MAG: DNA gyrase inhibitor YacG [Gemmataceae bacterium]|nr:DNA gyrase inhibitor YacG [Gemmataceae bacterium]